jgi:hexokinase
MQGKHIVLLNDTVATLLAGKSASPGKVYDSYIGFILGTGTNTCYIEKNSAIIKNPALNLSKSQIINIESGNFGLAPLSDLDLAFDQTTDNPGNYTFEKMFSGGYFGGLCLSTLKIACGDGIFSSSTSMKILSMNQLSSEDVNKYISRQESDRGPLCDMIENNEDEHKCIRIIECLVERAAKLVAANLSAVVLKTGKGRSADRPILITVEGTTFYKMHKLKTLFEKYFHEFLSGERQRFVEFAEIPQSSLAGAALAALIEEG